MRISELSRRVGVSTDTLRAWERRYGVLSPLRSAGNTRLYSSVDEARLRLMRRYIDEHVPVAQAAELARSARLTLRAGSRDAVPHGERRRARQALREALSRWDASAADAVVDGLLATHTASAVLRDLVLPGLAEVGERGAQGDLRVAEEHFATGVALRQVVGLTRGWDRGLGPRALIAAAPGDHHTIGLLCFGIALHALGWRITCLGAATPVAMLAEVARTLQPATVVVSCSLTGALAAEAEALRGLGARWPLVVAGPGVDGAEAAACAARHLSADAVSAAAVVAEL